ncbi:Trafficking protein particle complex subunit 10 [Cichlidogyrus casuarinus]|uniref:Trafficking protein particle complex subunit 10 n=1 Tax=Cichlidogyrus casuarinus TaxID=1844966 RepID=A0ABD2QG12_9PLAT
MVNHDPSTVPSMLSIKRTVLDQIRTEFDLKKFEKNLCEVPLDDTNKKLTRDLWDNLLQQANTIIKEFISEQIFGYNAVIKCRIDDRFSKDWSFADYFILQDELASLYSLIGLIEESLHTYDTLLSTLNDGIDKTDVCSPQDWVTNLCHSTTLELAESTIIHPAIIIPPPGCMKILVSRRARIASKTASLYDYQAYLLARIIELNKSFSIDENMSVNVGHVVLNRTLLCLTDSIRQSTFLKFNVNPLLETVWALLLSLEALDSFRQTNFPLLSLQTHGTSLRKNKTFFGMKDCTILQMLTSVVNISLVPEEDHNSDENSDIDSVPGTALETPDDELKQEQFFVEPFKNNAQHLLLLAATVVVYVSDCLTSKNDDDNDPDKNLTVCLGEFKDAENCLKLLELAAFRLQALAKLVGMWPGTENYSEQSKSFVKSKEQTANLMYLKQTLDPNNVDLGTSISANTQAVYSLLCTQETTSVFAGVYEKFQLILIGLMRCLGRSRIAADLTSNLADYYL